MAGGVGTRFWPRSRENHPKQLLHIAGKHTLIQSTVQRLRPLIPEDHIVVVSTRNQKNLIQEQLPFLKPHQLILEPKGRNTAPCIGLAALFIEKIDPDAVMVVLPADHIIKDNDKFLMLLHAASQVSRDKDCLVTIGIDPTYPSTGFGYIQYNDLIADVDGIPVHKIKTFAEKPDEETAVSFLDSGDFFWNSGIFIWKARTILNEIKSSLPELYDGLMEIKKSLGTSKQDKVIEKVYCQIKGISIDYGVMEHAEHVCVLKGDFGWSDVGTWDEVFKLYEPDADGNVSRTDHLALNSKGCYIDAEGKFVATIGVDDIIVVDTEDALLICHRNSAQEVKDMVDRMKQKGLKKYL